MDEPCQYEQTSKGTGLVLAGRIAAQVGNTLFLGFLGASAYFGYYTYRYSTQEVENLIEDTKNSENQFPGSDVRPSSPLKLLRH